MEYITQENKVVNVSDPAHNLIYPVRTFPKNVEFKLVETNDGYFMPYSFNGVILKNPSAVPAEEFYAMWFFKDGSCAIERRKEKDFVFVSEIWELRSAAKRLNLEVIVN